LVRGDPAKDGRAGYCDSEEEYQICHSPQKHISDTDQTHTKEGWMKA
ncbi:unnamed protein product, partial [marine sediment metagenome]